MCYIYIYIYCGYNTIIYIYLCVYTRYICLSRHRRRERYTNTLVGAVEDMVFHIRIELAETQPSRQKHILFSHLAPKLPNKNIQNNLNNNPNSPNNPDLPPLPKSNLKKMSYNPNNQNNQNNQNNFNNPNNPSSPSNSMEGKGEREVKTSPLALEKLSTAEEEIEAGSTGQEKLPFIRIFDVVYIYIYNISLIYLSHTHTLSLWVGY